MGRFNLSSSAVGMLRYWRDERANTGDAIHLSLHLTATSFTPTRPTAAAADSPIARRKCRLSDCDPGESGGAPHSLISEQ